MKILLTGDDGYRALGLRIVAVVLKEKGFDVKIAATKEERSSTGGSFPGKGNWAKDVVEGLETLWVDGTPADAVEVASYVYGKDFDLIISGANLGENVALIPPSGTIGAAVHGLENATAPRAMALSWDCPEELDRKNTIDIPTSNYEEYPKKTIARLIELALKNNFWGAGFLNFNLPRNRPQKLRICAPASQTFANFYGFSMKIDAGTYQKIHGPSKKLTGSLELDANALSQGYATVVPWLNNRYVNAELLALIGTEIPL